MRWTQASARIRLGRAARTAAAAIAAATVAACTSGAPGAGTESGTGAGTGSTAGTPPAASTGTLPSAPPGGSATRDRTATTMMSSYEAPPSPSQPSQTPPSQGPPSHAPGGDRPTGVRVTDTIATGLTTPWGLGFLPDGTALVTERDTATLLAIDPGGGHAVRTVGTVSGVKAGGEGGLLGLAVSATYRADHTVYVYYTSENDNRVAALRLDANATAIEDQRNILTGIPAAAIHNGGRLLVAADGTLFVGTGDATDGARAQDLASLGGKILHVSADGDPVAGHPFPRAPLVYSYGHRNVQGLAFDSAGQLWASEFGASRYDELNRIEPGSNYGWPDVEGPSDGAAGGASHHYVDPFAYWPTEEASPSGLAIVGETAFLAALRGVRLWLIPLRGSPGTVAPTPLLQGDYGRLRTVAVAPDGSLWLTTSNTDGRGEVRDGDDRILRLAVTG